MVEEEEVWSAQYLCTFVSLSLVDALLSSVECFFSLAILFSCCLCQIEQCREFFWWFSKLVFFSFLLVDVSNFIFFFFWLNFVKIFKLKWKWIFCFRKKKNSDSNWEEKKRILMIKRENWKQKIEREKKNEHSPSWNTTDKSDKRPLRNCFQWFLCVVCVCA